MQKPKVNLLSFGIATLLGCSAANALTPSSLLNRGQEKDNWCWNACSEMILDWSGLDRSQPVIADWAIGGVNQGNFLDTGAAGVGPYYDTVTKRTFYRRGIKQVLENFGPVSSERLLRALTWDEVSTELSANRPFIYAIYWTDSRGTIFGGHVGVGKDFAQSGKLVSVEDPWPMDSVPAPSHPGVSAIVPYDVIVGTGNPTYSKAVFGGGYFNNQWKQTLSLSRKADVVFLVDTTGSMGSYIDDVKAQATILLADLKKKFSDLRVAVVDYRDGAPFTGGVDYILKVRKQLTSDMVDAQAGIDSLDLGGGGDGPESLYSAVDRVARGIASFIDNDGSVSGLPMGSWREGAGVSRNIILMGDAPGHRMNLPFSGATETWTGGKSLEDCVTLLSDLAKDPAKGVRVQAVHVGTWTQALEDFQALATASGGKAAANILASDVSSVISGMFAEISAGRYPVASSGKMFPKFTFNVPGGGGGGTPKILTAAVDVEKFDTKASSWRSFARLNVPSTDLSEFQSKVYFAPGKYRWRLAGTNSRAAEVLPNKAVATIPAAPVSAFLEDKYTEFTRTAAVPSAVVKVTQDQVTPTGTRQELRFMNNPSAVSFAIKLEDVATKKLTTIIVSRSSTQTVSGAASGTLKVTVPCLANKSFKWQIQGLNEDRPSVDPTKWN